eukprot:930328-Amorphochlora_amoeboformis.AAC.2
MGRGAMSCPEGPAFDESGASGGTDVPGGIPNGADLGTGCLEIAGEADVNIVDIVEERARGVYLSEGGTNDESEISTVLGVYTHVVVSVRDVECDHPGHGGDQTVGGG